MNTVRIDPSESRRSSGSSLGPFQFRWTMLALYAGLSLAAGIFSVVAAPYFSNTSHLTIAAAVGAALGFLRASFIFLRKRTSR